MKEFVVTFMNSEDVKKEAKSVENLQKWLETFKLDNVPPKAIDELFDLIEIAEEKNKIALIDLVRLLLMHNYQAGHILRNHWEKIDLNIFGYLQCLDIKDESNKVM